MPACHRLLPLLVWLVQQISNVAKASFADDLYTTNTRGCVHFLHAMACQQRPEQKRFTHTRQSDKPGVQMHDITLYAKMSQSNNDFTENTT